MSQNIILLDSEEKVLGLKHWDMVKLPNSERVFRVIDDLHGKLYFQGGFKDWRYGQRTPEGNHNIVYIRIGKEGTTRALWKSRKEFWSAIQSGHYHIDDGV